jgi:voltage-gated potassium channel
MLFTLVRSLRKVLGCVRLDYLVLLTLVHFVCAYTAVLLTEAADVRLREPIQFWYYWATTVLTIGYGDLSPQSDMGRLVAPFFEFSGVMIFMAWLSKALTYTVARMEKKQKGLLKVKTKGHILIIGDYRENVVTEILANAIHDSTDDGHSPDVVGCFRNTGNDNPFLKIPASRFEGTIFRYVQASAGFSIQTLVDANASAAHVIYVRSDDDMTTVGIVCALMRHKVSCTIVALLAERASTHLLPDADNVRSVVPIQAALAVREAEDPGVGSVIADVLDVTAGEGVYSLLWKREVRTFAQVRVCFQSRFGDRAILLGYARKSPTGWESHVRPPAEDSIREGDRLVYIADKDFADEEVRTFLQAA